MYTEENEKLSIPRKGIGNIREKNQTSQNPNPNTVRKSLNLHLRSYYRG